MPRCLLVLSQGKNGPARLVVTAATTRGTAAVEPQSCDCCSGHVAWSGPGVVAVQRVVHRRKPQLRAASSAGGGAGGGAGAGASASASASTSASAGASASSGASASATTKSEPQLLALSKLPPSPASQTPLFGCSNTAALCFTTGTTTSGDAAAASSTTSSTPAPPLVASWRHPDAPSVEPLYVDSHPTFAARQAGDTRMLHRIPSSTSCNPRKRRRESWKRCRPNPRATVGTATAFTLCVPLAVPQVTQVSCGTTHALCVLHTGQLLAWGRNQHGKLGTGDNRPRLVPTPVQVTTTPSRVVQCSAGWSHSAAVTADGAVYTWGCATFGRLGCVPNHSSKTKKSSLERAVLQPRRVERPFNTFYNCVSVACGSAHTLFVATRATAAATSAAPSMVFACGRGSGHRLGLGGDCGNKWVPELLAGLPVDARITGCAAGSTCSVVLDDGGQAYWWGTPPGGSDTSPSPHPVPQLQPFHVHHVAISGDMLCAIVDVSPAQLASLQAAL